MVKSILSVFTLLFPLIAFAQDIAVNLVAVDKHPGMALEITGVDPESNPEIRKEHKNNAIWGSFESDEDKLLFYPRIPLKKGITYELINYQNSQPELLRTFDLGTYTPESQTVVEAIYPLSNKVPQNLLRVHLKFSRPMTPQVSHKYVRLINMTTGQTEENVFERMNHEIWNEKGTLLTLYLDPGRIKTGLGLNQELGLPLSLGQTYKLEIDAGWEDVYGIPLSKTKEKVFEAVSEDRQRLSTPEIKMSFSTNELVVDFGQAINEPQMSSFSQLKFNRKPVQGTWEAMSSSKLKFIPEKPLDPGNYMLNVSSELEDLAGNSFRRKFEEKHLSDYMDPFIIEKSMDLVKGDIPDDELDHRDSLKMLVNKYYELNIKVFQANSTPEEVDQIFELFTSDFTYVHPKYGGIYTREDLHNGYLRNQKNGGYDGSTADIKVINMIVGLNAVAVEKVFVSKTENGLKDGDRQMTLFEFKGDKILRIFEYW